MLWRQKGKGGFAVAFQIDKACRQAMGLATMAQLRGLGQTGGLAAATSPIAPIGSAETTPDIDAMRIAAMQEIQARCKPFMDDPTLREPMSGDSDGFDFQEAYAKTALFGHVLSGFPRRALEALAAQGMLASAYPYLTGSPQAPGYFEGQPMAGLPADEYARAMHLAYLQTTMDTSSQRPDLRALTDCLHWGACDRSAEALALRGLPADSPSIARIRALAPRLAAAMATGNVAAFAPPN